MFFHSFIAMENAFTLFFTVNSSVNAAGHHLAGGGFIEKAIPQGYVISLCGVVVIGIVVSSPRCRVRVLLNSFFPSFFFFPFLCRCLL